MYIKSMGKLYFTTRIWHNIPKKGEISFFDEFNENISIKIDDIDWMSIYILVD